MTPELLRRLIQATAETVDQHADELTALDRAIGDGDHGYNMRRGFSELLAQQEQLAALPLPAALQKAGLVLVMRVGGASGPLFGTLLMEMGKVAPEGTEPTLADLLRMLDAGIAGIQKRGKSQPGEKTMLDVLVPVSDALRRLIADGAEAEAGTRLLSAAAHALHRTGHLVATKGRAAFLGERSRGHIDPGACSSALLIGAAIAVLDPRKPA